MSNMNSSKQSLFLMELIVAIMFFSLSAAVCVSLFSSAHLAAKKTEDLRNAIKWAQSISEAFVGEKGDLSSLSRLFPDAFITETPSDSEEDSHTFILIFDDEWNTINTETSAASYEIILKARILDASDVYSDVTDYGTALTGKAAVCDLKVLDTEGTDSVLQEISEGDERLIFSNTVDTYIGTEAN